MSVYVYAITGAQHSARLDDLHGVGEGEPPLRTVASGPLAACVSDAPEDLRGKRRDLAAHHAVQERLLAEGPVLPMRFGLVAPDDDAVRAALDENAEEYTRRLAELRDRVEFNLKASQEEETALRQVVADSEEVRRLSEVTRGGGGTHEDQLRLGELIGRELQARQEAVADDVLADLRSYVDAEKRSAAGQDRFLNVSFLVHRDRIEDFAAAEQRLAERYAPLVQFQLRGPLPPYSFV
ncbi:GvpL/GvpF family gas vesicle protein [Streptomyces sp. B1866]|uniref:GvpL/GvpF family gas vesicle protein n=1 Tax=Streptomyces sp. B1866 TaxID=3075431 RepID=UPI002890C159|nr:GvpL/GvpF family gas vesicle protein [Streptomyces sp. B1866]MDT3400297.1 GvpL/GvpF family gas vesicle protein [Streptomyces sp. B1866]